MGQPRPARQRASPLGAYGERPPSPFGGLPVAEIAIFAGAVALVVGVIRHGGAALIGGVVICLLGVLEVTTREHFSGYRSHTVLLAAIPAVAVEFLIALTVGPPAIRALLLVARRRRVRDLRVVPAQAIPARAAGADRQAGKARTTGR